MAWCYTFGVAIGDEGCREPMMVVEGQPRCECAACEVACEGLFPACQTLVFTPGGRALQIKSLPPNLLTTRSAAPAAEDNGRPTVTEAQPGLGVDPLQERISRLELRVIGLERTVHDALGRPSPEVGPGPGVAGLRSGPGAAGSPGW